ncbi:hypothetical protein [Hymenobacter bucti]|uniref:Phosphodiester glycosidase domain-containing protein n=1 Tax=Hymenobacter bucti TaxID=1844114 RepID=A0ABW4QX19_9BACT
MPCHISTRYRLLLCWLLGLLACSPKAAPDVRTEQRKTAKGTLYSLFYPQNLAVRVVTSRPNPGDSQYWLSVAAAYTDLQTSQPLDLLVCGGRVLQSKAKVGFLDGSLTILGNTLTIGQLPKGQSPPSAQLAQVRAGHGTLLLQELLVFRGKNLKAAGGSVFQRRALAEFANHRFAVVESTSNYLTMKQFADDLLELGAQNALYLDMGDWDEGWYKRQGRVVALGNRRTETARQSNWLVFASPAP